MDERVEVLTGERGVTLVGTYTAARGVHVGSALLISGSGPQDRDETVAGHAVFAVLAEALADRGVSTVRFDDRGVGESGGTYLGIDGKILLDDLSLQWSWLRGRDPGVMRGVIGHSQGGIFALRLARRVEGVDRVVMLGSAIRDGMSFMMAMRRLICDDLGLAGADREGYLAHSRGLFESIVRFEDPLARVRAVREMVVASVDGVGDGDLEEFGGVDGYVDFAVKDAMEWEVRDLLMSDPGADLGVLRVPVLGVWGECDRHVDVVAERGVFDRVCSAACASAVIGSRNHLFQISATGGMDSYADDGAPMLDPVGGLIARWFDRAEWVRGVLTENKHVLERLFC